MKTAKYFFVFVSLIICYLLLPPSVFAKKCDLTDQIDYKGPYSVLWKPENSDKDCSYPPDGSSLDMEVINHGRLTSKLVDLRAHFVGQEDKLIPNGDGTLNITLSDLSTFGIGGDILSKVNENGVSNHTKLIKYQKNIEAYKNYDITHLYREAYADGVSSYEAFKSWACDRDLCICNGADCHINPSIYSNTSQLAPLKDQLQELLDTANEIIRCNDPNYATTHKCSTFYPLPGGNSLTIANIVKQRLDPNDLIGSWEKFDDKLKFQTYSLHITQSAPTFILIVPQETECNTIFCLIAEFFGFNYNPDKPGFIKAIIPETQTFKNGVIATNNRMTPLKDQKQAIAKSSNLTAAAHAPSDAGDYLGQPQSLLTSLLATAKSKDPYCGQPPPRLFENLGASSTPPKNTQSLSLKYLFTAISKHDATKDQQKLYCVYVFSPPDLVDADTALAASNDSIIRKLFPLKTAGFETKIDAPQAFNSTGHGQTPNNQICLEYTMLPNGEKECAAWEDNYVEYTGGADRVNQPAGELPMITKNITFGIARPLKEIIPPDQCLVPWLDAQARQQGFNLAETLNANQYNNSLCPNPIKPASSPPTIGDCRQALFERGACPGGMDCIDYICANSGGLNCSLLIMIAANESGGLFSCMSDLSSIKHFGCDPWGRAGYSNTIESKLQCAVNTLKGYTDLTAALQNYGYNSVNDLPWGMFGLTPATSLTSDNNNIAALKTEIYGGDTTRWWRAYCNRFPNLVRESGQQADPASYSCDRY